MVNAQLVPAKPMVGKIFGNEDHAHSESIEDTRGTQSSVDQSVGLHVIDQLSIYGHLATKAFLPMQRKS